MHYKGPCRVKNLKIATFTEAPFMVKMQSEKYFLFFPIFTKEMQAKINELESESKIYA